MRKILVFIHASTIPDSPKTPKSAIFRISIFKLIFIGNYRLDFVDQGCLKNLPTSIKVLDRNIRFQNSSIKILIVRKLQKMLLVLIHLDHLSRTSP